jgi:hypothetical protein
MQVTKHECVLESLNFANIPSAGVSGSSANRTRDADATPRVISASARHASRLSGIPQYPQRSGRDFPALKDFPESNERDSASPTGAKFGHESDTLSATYVTKTVEV